MTDTKNIFLAAAFFAISLVATIPATAQRTGEVKIKLLAPVLEWQNFDAKAQQVNGKSVNTFTFGVSNWKMFSDEMFAAAPDLPACGANKSASRTWLAIFDFQTGEAFNAQCAFQKSEDLKTFKFNIESKNVPTCVYITLTDRKTKKVYKSNPVNAMNGKDKCEVIKP